MMQLWYSCPGNCVVILQPFKQLAPTRNFPIARTAGHTTVIATVALGECMRKEDPTTKGIEASLA